MNYSKKLFVVIAAMLLMGVSARASQTDDDIASAAKKSYVFTNYLKDDSVDVRSNAGVVTLTGTVKDESHRALAENTVAAISGVKSIDNQIVYKGENPLENSDGWISMKIKASLLYNRNVSGLKTQVFVTNGMVTLKGEADSQAQKDLAGEYAQDIKGVTGVDNQMTIAANNPNNKPDNSMDNEIDDASITAQIRMAFLTHQSTSAFKTGVSTTDGVVTLTGDATSDAGKDMAAKVAGDIKGVKKVVNNMHVVNP